MRRHLEVVLHGCPVGELTETRGERVEFRLIESYYRLVPRLVLGQNFEDDLEKVHHGRRNQGLPDFFVNLLPEARLRDLIELTASLKAGDDPSLLACVGRDLPGAVVIRPFGVEEDGQFQQEPRGSTLENEAAGSNENLRFSLAGFQLKFSMLREAERLTLPPGGVSGDWIVKLDSPTFPQLPQNEFSMLEWARAAGFEVPECHLHSASDLVGFPRRHALPDSKVLAIRRYDRLSGGRRLHQEDFAQVVGLPPKRKYEHITYGAMAHLVRRILDEEAVDEFVRRLVFTIACGNNDAHLKNWSLTYPDTLQARWSPLYDQVATVAWRGPDRALSLKLAQVKEFGGIDRSTFERFAEAARMDRRRVMDLVDGTLERLHRAWQEIGSHLPLPKDHAAALREHWRKVPLLRSASLFS